MKKISLFVMAVMCLSEGAYAAEIYNNDGNKLDLTGSVRGRHYLSKDSSMDGDNSYVRLGFLGSTRINSQLTGYGRWETNILLNQAESDTSPGMKTRYGYAGLGWADYGTLDYGRNDGVLYDVTSITDFAPIFDFLTDSYTDVFMTGRANGLLTYRTHDFFGLTPRLKVTLQYQSANGEGENNSNRNAYSENGDGGGASVSYSFDNNVSLLGAYASSKRTQQQNAMAYGQGDKADMFAVGLRYNPGKFYGAVLYSQGMNITPIKGYGFANKTMNYEAIVRYVTDSGLVPSLGWFQSRGKDIGSYGNVTLSNYVDAGLSYFLNKNMLVYADYKINLLSSDTPFGISTDDAVGLGITYQF